MQTKSGIKYDGETMTLGNGESITRGIFPQSDGTFLAVTFTLSEVFKTRKGAEKWFLRWTGKAAQ